MQQVSEQPQTSQAPAEGQIDLRAYARTLMKRRWMIVGVFLGVLGCTVIYTFRQPKIYSASATIVMEMASPKVLGSGMVQDVAETSTPVWFSKEYFETQYNVMKSRVVAERVAHVVKTARDDRLLNLDAVPTEDMRTAGLAALAALRERLDATPDPALAVQGRLVVEPVKESRIARLSVDDRDPVLAAALANAFAQSYMDYNLASKTSTTASASESLETQLPDLEDKLQKSAQALYEFRKKHDIASASFEDKQTMVTSRLNRFNEELTNARVKKASLKSRFDAISALKSVDVDAERLALVPSELAASVQQLKYKVFELRSECADLEDRLLPQHPRLSSCQTRLVQAEKSLKLEIDSALNAAKLSYADVVATERNLLTDLNEVKVEILAINEYEPDYLKLKRAYDTNVRLYDLALKSLKESGLSGSTRLNNVNMLDPALAPTYASKPKVQTMLLVGALLGLLLGIGLAFGIELLDNTVTSQEHIEEKLQLSFLGILPSIGDKVVQRDLIVAEQPKSAVAECCRAIRTNLLFMSPDRALKTLLVTSAGPQDGKTTTAASLAITMAKSGNRVLLVDGDLRRPRVHKAFKVPNGAGLSSLILGQGDLATTAKSSGVENLFLLTCGPVPPNPAELLHTHAFKELLLEMGRQFDRIIIDSPPVGAVADAIVMSTQVDGTVLVLKSGVTSKDLARRTVRSLRDVKGRLLGAILNDVDLGDRRSGGYYYYSKYGYYYGESETPAKDGSAA